MSSSSQISVIFIPGWLIPVKLYEAFLNALPDRFNVTILNLPSAVSAAQALDELEQQVQHSPMLIIGHSLGGMWALALAERFNHPPCFCICSNPRFIAEKNWPGTSEKALQQLTHLFVTQPDRALSLFQRLLCQGENRILFQKLKRTQPTPCKQQLNGLIHLQQLDVRHHLRENHAFWLAENDALIPYSLAQHLPSSVTCLHGKQGHLPFLSQPEALTHTITQWFFRTN